MKNFKSVGTWWNSNNIELLEIDKTVYALNGWNGEKYTECWKCEGEFNTNASIEKYEITPVFEQVDDDFEIVGYEVF